MKPFSIQAPEEVAKAYGGNKQQIAQAAQLGIVDPTAAVLAGMFIDRMRGAQAQEGANPSTVAQDVMGGAPVPPAPQPPAPAPSPLGGLGATSQAAPPMAPPMEAPQGGAPVGMAAGGMAPPYTQGGLDGLPLPDTMFDEPGNGGFNDGYAGGGLVAFAKGGMSDLYDDVEYWESGGKHSAVSPKGARGVMQLMPGTARDPGFGIAPVRDDSEAENRRVGREYLDALYRKYGDRDTALMAYNWGPGNVDKWVKSGRPADAVPAETRKYVANIAKGSSPAVPERDTSTASGRMASLDDIDRYIQGRFGHSADEDKALGDMRAHLTEQASDEYGEKQRKQDMWATLAEIGFNMASSKSPYVLQAIGEAAAAALPGAKADKKERKALKDRALEGLIELGARDRKEAQEKFKLAADVWQQGISQEQFDKKMGLEAQQLQQQATLAREEMGSRERTAEIAATSRDTVFDVAYRNNYNKLKAEADAGTWRSPTGGPISDEMIRYWAQQHALEDVNKYKQTQNPMLDANGDGVPDAMQGAGGGQSAPNTSQFKVLGTE